MNTSLSNSWVRLFCAWLAVSLGAEGSALAQSGSLSISGPVAPGPGGTGGWGSSEGDLEIRVGCDMWAYLDGHYFSVDLTLHVEGENPVHELYQGWTYVGGNVHTYVRAGLYDRRVDCWATDSLGWAHTWGTLKGSGPNAVTVTLRSFIPYEYVGNPWNLTRIFEGDNRGFQEYGGNSRTTSILEVLNPAVNNGDRMGEWHEAGMTIEYDRDTSVENPPFGRITDEARNDWTPGYPMKTEWATASNAGIGCSGPWRLGPNPSVPSSSHQFNCAGEAGNPLVLAPPIQWNLDFTFEYGNNQLRYSVNGCTGWFPSFEAYGNGVTLFEIPDSGNPMDLFYGCGRSVSRNGVF